MPLADGEVDKIGRLQSWQREEAEAASKRPIPRGQPVPGGNGRNSRGVEEKIEAAPDVKKIPDKSAGKV